MTTPENIQIPKAFLVGVQLPKVTDSDNRSSLAELERLVTTLGYQVIGRTSQRRQSVRHMSVLGEGKLKQIAEWTGGTGVIGRAFYRKKTRAALRQEKEKAELEEAAEEDLLEGSPEDSEVAPEEGPEQDLEANVATPPELAEIIIFDCDLSPSQLRNMESAFGVPVLDRTGVIIEIFSRHARTRAARLQVEIARLTYMAPRIRETSAGSEDRQGGGIGGKGAGESSIELDRRRLRDRIKELKIELDSIAQEQDLRRERRSQEISVALVGYTNAGKSSLMRALTGSDVLVADKLFATLDTTVRLLYPESLPKILISDTVGFIKKLPHDLVASFKSTLDEALNASLLLYVVDSSDETFRSQLEVTKSVLAEVGAGEVENWLVLNKADRLSAEEKEKLAKEFPKAIFLSSLDPIDVDRMRTLLIKHFENNMEDVELLVPYATYGAIGEIRGKIRVLAESYNEHGTVLKIRAHSADIQKLKTRYGLR